MHRYVLTILGCLTIAGQITTATEDMQVLFQEAFYQEEVMGNLEQAMTIYRKLLDHAQATREMQALLKLRMAFCHEKLGQFAAAEDLYTTMLIQYPDFARIVRLANSKIREHKRRKQIIQLKQQLEKLQDFSPSLRLRLEKEIKTLQERILALQKEKTSSDKAETLEFSRENTQAAPRVSKKTPEKFEQQKLSEALALHLYHTAYKLYQEGFLRSALESLKKSLSFDNDNNQARDLLEKVQAMLAQRKAPHFKKVHNHAGSPLSEEEIASVIASEARENLQFITVNYDALPLIKKWQLSPTQQKIWVANCIELIRSQGSAEDWSLPAAVHFRESQFVVNQTASFQENLKLFWQALLASDTMFHVQVSLVLLPQLSTKVWQQLWGELFYPAKSGVFYKALTDDQSQQIFACLAATPTLVHKQFRANFLLQEEIAFKDFQEIPMVQGYREKALNFKFYSQGTQIICQRGDKKQEIQLEVFVQKIQQPVDVVITTHGPLEQPYLLKQLANVNFIADSSKTILIRGLVNPYPHAEEKQLIALYRVKPLSIQKFLTTERSQSAPVNQQPNGSEHVLRYYDIHMWQNLQNTEVKPFQYGIGQRENRDQFILRFFQGMLQQQQFPVSLKIMKQSLVAYGSLQSHKALEKCLQTLRQNAQKLCYLTIYLLSLERYTFRQFLKSQQLTPEQEDAFQIYTIDSSEKQLLESLQHIEDVKFHYTVGPIIIGNTQCALLKNCQISSFTEGLHFREGDILYGKIADLPKGVVIQARPIIFSSQSGILELTASIHQNEGNREVTYAISPQLNMSLKIPATQVQRGQIRFSFLNDKSYILTGFSYGKNVPNRNFIFLIIPQILQNKDT